MSIISAIANDFLENYLKKHYKDAHYLAFTTRVPVSIREKLSDEDLRQLSDISLEIFHNALNTVKDEIVKRFGG